MAQALTVYVWVMLTKSELRNGEIRTKRKMRMNAK